MTSTGVAIENDCRLHLEVLQFGHVTISKSKTVLWVAEENG